MNEEKLAEMKKKLTVEQWEQIQEIRREKIATIRKVAAKQQARNNTAYHSHMAEKFGIRHRDSDGLLAVVWQILSEAEDDKARYWREKAGE